MSLAIVLPCFNEEGNIKSLVERVFEAVNRIDARCEVVLVDDGSSDATWDAIMAEAIARTNLVAIRHESNRGIHASWLSGLDSVSSDVICFMDADLQNPPEALPGLWDALQRSRCDIVQGVRSPIEWDRDSRYWSSRSLNALLNLLFGDRATDNKSGFVMGPRAVLSDVLRFRKRYRYPQTFIRVAARSKGYTVEERETLFLPRRTGKSFLSNRPTLHVYAGVVLDLVSGLSEFGRGIGHPTDSTAVPHLSEPLRGVHPYRGWRRLLFEVYFLTMPLHAWLLRRSVRKIYFELQATQWLNSGELRELQRRKLQRMVQHAYAHVPYYREAFDRAGVSPSAVASLEDLRKLPLLEKADVRKHLYFDLFSDTHRKSEMHKISTSGSTGEPFVMYADRPQLEIRAATTLRALEWTGWRFGDRQMRLWHQTLGMSRMQAFRERLDALLLRRKFIPAFELTENGLRELGRQLDAFRPTLVDGYAESLNFLALYLEQHGSLEFRPRGVMSSAQVLPSQVRATIESQMGTRVFDKYGAREFSGIAYQCVHGEDHHVMDESYIVELLTEGRPSRPGEVGEIVITDLNNFSMPFIRYRIGDLAVAVDDSTPCPCGRGLSRIGEIYGRTQALVHCANGRWLPGTFFAHFFKDHDHLVRFFQVRQEVHGAFRLLVVQGPQWTEADWLALLADLREYVGETTITVEFTDEIPLLRTGKRSPVISEVHVDFQGLESRKAGHQ